MYVLEGEFAIEIGDRTELGGPGTWVFIPRETAHAWKNVGGKAARAIFLFLPAKAAKLFEDLGQRQGSIDELDSEATQALLRDSGWEILGPSPL